MKHILKKDLKAAEQRFDTRRGQYLYLTKLGYSQSQIAEAYGISKRAVWQAIHSAATPQELGKLQRYRVPVGGR
jgi:DNA-directed RNA polymerase specialized sigma24 family protein